MQQRIERETRDNRRETLAHGHILVQKYTLDLEGGGVGIRPYRHVMVNTTFPHAIFKK